MSPCSKGVEFEKNHVHYIHVPQTPAATSSRLHMRRRHRPSRTPSLGPVLHRRRTLALGAVRGRSDKLAALQRPPDIEVVPDLVEHLAPAPQRDVGAVPAGQRAPDPVERVRLAGRGRDARVLQPPVRRQRLEQVDSRPEKVGRLLPGPVAVVAPGREGADAGAVLGPFVLPKGLVVALVVLPEPPHVGQGVGGAVARQDVLDSRVGAAAVALGGIRAVTVVGPEAVDRPGVCTAARVSLSPGYVAARLYLVARWPGRCPRTASGEAVP